LKEICKQLTEWAEEESGLYMSGKTIQAYYNLRSCLLSNPGDGENYTVRQADKLWEARVMFRQQLRKDIGIMHQSEKQIKS
jgi:hypothetical protein